MNWTRRKPLRGTRNALRSMGEALEPRLLLAVTAAADNYVALEDVGFATGATAVVPRRSQGGWAIFDEIPLAGANANTYPDANQAPARWYSRAYNINQPSFAAWDTIPNQGLSAPFAHELVTVLTPATAIHAPANLENTVLARKTFALTAAQAAATQMTLDFVCDDGCVFYVNDKEVHRVNMPVGAITPNTLATAGGSELAYASVAIDLTTLGVSLFADATNVLAVEVHNANNTSSDLGFDAALSIAGGQNGTRANDTVDTAVAPVNTYFWDGIANVSTTTTVTGPATGAGGVTVGTVTITPVTGDFRFDPVTTGAGVGYVGEATFRYVLRDSAVPVSTSTATATITIGAVNDAPIAKDEAYAIVRGTGALVVGATAGSTYLSPGSQWYYSNSTDDQDVENPEWRGPPNSGFAPGSGTETGWNAAPLTAPIGFETDLRASTIANTGIATYYFANTFGVPGTVPNQLRMSLLVDDCAAVYINGVEVYRSPELPYGHGYATLCTDGVGGSTEQVVREIAIPTAGLNLQAAGNTIAAEVHQLSLESSDILFDLSLRHGIAGLLTNDSDVDDPIGDLSVQVIDQSEFTAAVGTLAVQPNGAFTFTPANASVTGEFSFTYRVVDNGQPTGPVQSSREVMATITVLATPHDRPPGGVVDIYETDEDTVLTVTKPQPVIEFGSQWDYFDEMQNGKQAAAPLPPETYPLDSTADADATPGVADPWYSQHFNPATSNAAIGAWKTGNGIFAGPIRGLTYGPGTTPLAGIGGALATGFVGQNTVDTYLFRRTFVLEDWPESELVIVNALFDDGMLLYVNDVPMYRFNMPVPPYTSTTFASAAGPEDGYGSYLLDFDDVLRPGVNTIAVEIHQASATSSDAGFDMQLSIWPGAGVLGNDVDPDGDVFTSAVVVTPPANGTVLMNADGTFVYTPNEDFSGIDSFEYVVRSNGLESAPTTVFIGVNSVDDAPEAVNDTYSVRNNETLNIVGAAGVLANDNGEGAIQLVLDQSGGEIIFHEAGLFVWNNTNGNFADGSFIFEPTAGFVGSAVFPYTVQDSLGLRATGTVTINVLPSTLPGDLDGDGDVDATDLATLIGNFGLGSVGLASAELGDGDMNGDGRVGVADAILLHNAISPGGSAPAAVLAKARAERAAGVDAVMRPSGAVWELIPRRTAPIPGDADDVPVVRSRRSAESRAAKGSTRGENSVASNGSGETTTGETSLRGRRESGRTARARAARS